MSTQATTAPAPIVAKRTRSPAKVRHPFILFSFNFRFSRWMVRLHLQRAAAMGARAA